MDKSTVISLVYLLLFAPLAAIPVIALFKAETAKVAAFTASLVPFILSLFLLGPLMGGEAFGQDGYSFYHAVEWIAGPGYNVNFALGIDGISLYLVLMTTLLFPLILLYSWNKVSKQVRMYYVMLMLMETAIIGFFLSMDLLLFYVFFELVLIPSIFFIGIWGSERRQYAAIKFFLYTLAGSLLMLIAILYMGMAAVPGIFTTDYFALLKAGFDPSVQGWLFLAFAISFAIKAPIFPFHTWQADAYAESSTTGTIIMAALLSKMGVYGLIRFCLPLFPDSFAEYAPIMAILAVIGILYGAMAAFAQKDMKRLLAYSSLSHMGFIALGIFVMQGQALSGAVLQMVAHGIGAAALFFLVGMIEDRGRSRMISDYQGIAKQLPYFAFLFVLSVMASVGLPGLSGFVGEFMILLGAFGASVAGSKVLTALAALGVIFAAIYLLNMTRKVLFGAERDDLKNLPDLNWREMGLLLPLVILMFWIGLHATPFLKHIDQSTAPLVQQETTSELPPRADGEVGNKNENLN